MKIRFVPFAFIGLPICLAQTSPSPGSSGSGEAVELPQFNVSSARTNSYRATDSLSAARTGGSLIDTPATVNVLTREFFEDIGANSLLDATQYVSGISNGRLGGANGISERQVIRGFENDGRTIDNFRAGFQANLDPSLFERVEIVKGPDAILAPTGTPGGSLNVITKSPLFTAANTASLELGNYFSQKLTIDSTGPIGNSGHFAYRVITGGQDAETYVPGRLKQWNVNPEFTWRISDHTQLTFKYSYIDWTSEGGASNPGTVLIAGSDVANGSTAPDSPSQGFGYRAANGVPSWAARTDKVHRAAAEFTTALTDRVSMRLAACFIYDHMNIDGGQDAFPGQSNRYNPYTGIYTPNQTWALDATSGQYLPTFSAEYDPTNVSRVAQISPVWNHDIQIQNDYAGNFQAGPVSFRPLFGGVYQHTLSSTYNETAPLPSVNLFSPDNDPVHPPASAYTTSASSATVTTNKQLYAFLRTGFLSDRLLFTTGVSRIWIDTETTNRLKNVVTPLEGHQDTYLGGVLFKPAKNASIYASYSSNAALVNFNNLPLWQQGKQYEFGTKLEFFNQRLSISGAHFQITQNNLVTPNPVYLSDPIHNPISLLSDQTNRGYELDLVGGLTKDISLLASFTSQRTRDAFGRRPRNTPDSMVNLLLKYDIHEGTLKGLSFFAGANHVGKASGENPSSSGTALGVIEQVSFYIPARTIASLGAQYHYDRWRFNLNVDNAFDERTVYQASGRFNLTPFPALNVRLTTTMTF